MKKFGDYAETVFFSLASSLVGIVFLLMGIQATFSISEKAADTCNIWSLFYVLGLWLTNYSDLYGKIARRFTPRNTKRHRSGWKFTIEFAWMLISLLIALIISGWIWAGRNPEILELTTNGCSLFVMAVTSFMLYLNYTE